MQQPVSAFCRKLMWEISQDKKQWPFFRLTFVSWKDHGNFRHERSSSRWSRRLDSQTTAQVIFQGKGAGILVGETLTNLLYMNLSTRHSALMLFIEPHSRTRQDLSVRTAW